MKFFSFNRQSGEAQLVYRPSSATPQHRPKNEKVRHRVVPMSEVMAETASQLGQRRGDVEATLAAFLAIVASCLQAGEAVQLAHFGVLKPRRPKSGPCRNPRTGAAVNASGRTSVCFKPARGLKAIVNAAAS